MIWRPVLRSDDGRAEQNVLRPLEELETAGVVRLDKGGGGGQARRPQARKPSFLKPGLP
jgi:predicted transcriptional regulator